MKNVLKFLSSLKRHNDREWFLAHKEEYNVVKEKTDRLAGQLIDKIAEFDKGALRLTPKDVTYRIYRDTRFSADKTPYKTHIGIFINPPYGKKSERLGYYLHIEPGGCFFSCGQICLPSETIRRIRQGVYDNIEEYIEIVESPDFRECFSEIGANPLKTYPRGFPADWPYIDYIRPRDFFATGNLPDDFITAPDLADRLMPYLRQAYRFISFHNYSIDPEE